MGKLTKVKLVYHNSRSKGKAFIEYAEQESANAAVAQLNGKDLDGRELHVEYQGLKPFVPEQNDRTERRRPR